MPCKEKGEKRTAKIFQLFLKNLLTNALRCAIIYELSTRKLLERLANNSQKTFEKLLKNLLTNARKYDIIYRSRQERRQAKRFEKNLKNF